ncbi:hypothetical protein [Paragemmobacter aquarius]|nr:hypothetical protein [Gemmobacter aquarius]
MMTVFGASSYPLGIWVGSQERPRGAIFNNVPIILAKSAGVTSLSP